MDLTFERVFKLPLYTLRLCLAHPGVPKDLKWSLKFLVAHGLYILHFLLFLSNIILYNIKENDFIQTCKNGTVCMAIASAIFEHAILMWKSYYISKLFENIKIDYINVKTQTAEEQEIVLKYAKQSIWVGKMWFVVGPGGTLIFPMKNILMHIYYYCISEFRWIHLYDTIYPKIIDDRKDVMVMFCILNLLVTFSAGYGSCVYCAFCPLGPNFLLHACGQLEILTKRVKSLFSVNHSLQDVTAELKLVAMDLQRIYDFVNDIQQAFRIAYEMILKVTSVVLPLTVYAIKEAIGEGEFNVEFIVFAVGSVIISASPCYYSELLVEKAEMFRSAMYSCGWERTWDRRTRTMILLLLQRASRPIAIRTIFKTLCLETLTDVYRQSYALFNLMNAMWN